MPEFSDSKAAQALDVAVSSGRQQYLVAFHIIWYNQPGMDFTCPITVKPRPREDYELLLEWYYELPATRIYTMWTEDAVFAHPFYIRESPHQTKVFYRTDKDGEEKCDPFRAAFSVDILRKAYEAARGKRPPSQTTNPSQTANNEILLWNAYREFIDPLFSRTPEALARIERTNELAAKIMERAKEPDSTFSQNMVEFIQLRGFLVDMRYAENLEAEEMAFQKLMDFVDQSQDKELWVPFFHEIGLNSIQHHTHFPPQKVEQYRTRFAERFQIPKRELFE
jgi:hypothetical protein